MTAAPARTVTASILFLGIHSYGRRAVVEQLAVRDRLNAAVAQAIARVAPADRIVVDTPDGAAVVFLGDPSEAFAAASALAPALVPADGGNALPVRCGLNHGPLQLAESDQMLEVSGDGIEVAESLMGFAQPGQILTSRAFRDAVDRSGTDPRFQPIGTRTDPSVRAHEVFALDPSAQRALHTASARPSIRPRALVVASVVAAALVAVGFAAREAREVIEAKRRPGVIKLTVRPTADVIVDSAYKGTTPPMNRIEVPAGRHTVELKRAGHPSRNVQVELKAGEEIELQHTFLERPRPKTFWERLGL